MLSNPSQKIWGGSSIHGKGRIWLPGRLILSNSSLSNMPIYYMGIFLLHEGFTVRWTPFVPKISGEVISVSSNITWWNERMYAYPRISGGWGIINTRQRNKTLLTKWVWRLRSNKEDDIACKLLRAKYMGNKSLQQCTGRYGSQFWKWINKVQSNFNWGGRGRWKGH